MQSVGAHRYVTHHKLSGFSACIIQCAVALFQAIKSVETACSESCHICAIRSILLFLPVVKNISKTDACKLPILPNGQYRSDSGNFIPNVTIQQIFQVRLKKKKKRLMAFL